MTMSRAAPSFTGRDFFQGALHDLQQLLLQKLNGGGDEGEGQDPGHHVRAGLQGGKGNDQGGRVGRLGMSFRVTFVRMPRVPSEPITRSLMSYPVVFFTTLEEKSRMEPSGKTASTQRTKSRVRP